MSPQLVEFFQSLLSQGQWLLLLIVIDLVLGVTVALKQGIFRFDKIADFLKTYVPELVGWVGLSLLTLLPPEVKSIASIGEGLATLTYAFIVISAFASIVGHAQAMGLPVNLTRAGLPPTEKPLVLVEGEEIVLKPCPETEAEGQTATSKTK